MPMSNINCSWDLRRMEECALLPSTLASVGHSVAERIPLALASLVFFTETGDLELLHGGVAALAFDCVDVAVFLCDLVRPGFFAPSRRRTAFPMRSRTSMWSPETR